MTKLFRPPNACCHLIDDIRPGTLRVRGDREVVRLVPRRFRRVGVDRAPPGLRARWDYRGPPRHSALGTTRTAWAGRYQKRAARGPPVSPSPTGAYFCTVKATVYCVSSQASLSAPPSASFSIPIVNWT